MYVPFYIYNVSEGSPSNFKVSLSACELTCPDYYFFHRVFLAFSSQILLPAWLEKCTTQKKAIVGHLFPALPESEAILQILETLMA